jgi:type I restriction enzyme S subunit
MVEYTDVINTDAAWLPQIPAHWQLQKIDALFTERKTKVSDKDYAPLSVTKKGILPQLEHAAKSNDSDNRKLVKAGDFVINSRSDRKGSCGVSKLDGSVSLINLVLTPRSKLNNDYVHYLLRNYRFSEEYYRNGRGIVADLWTTRYSEMRTILLPVPPRAEQDQIVRFLDWKVSEINKLIGIRRKEIQELEELKASSMRTVFSEGLSSDTKINSNEIDWLGSFPQRWKVMRLKSVLQSYFGGTWGEEPVGDKNDLLCIRVADFDFDNLTVKPTANTYRHYSKSLISERSLQDGDIILEKSGGGDKTPVGRVICYHSFGDSKVMFANFSECLRPDKGQVLPVFLATELKVFYQSGYIRNYYNQTTGIQNVTVPQYLSMPIVVPPKPEQEIIVQYLNSACSKIDSLIESTHKKIAELTEMKSVIISEVVTGKIDVRNITVPQYEHVDDIYDDNNEDGEETEVTEIDGEEG